MVFLQVIMALENILNKMKPFILNDVVVQRDHDGGDSAQRTGTLFAMSGIIGNDIAKRRLFDIGLDYNRSIAQHEVGPGYYRRSNQLDHWSSNPNNFSRDQWSILQLAFAVNGDQKRLKESMAQLVKRKGFHQNVHPGTDAPDEFRKMPDLAHPSHFSVYIRGMGYWWAYPVLVVIDLLLLGDLAVRQFHDPANDLDNMLSQHILYANYRYRTPVGFIAMKLYELTNWRAKLRQYHGPARNGIPPLADLIILAYDSFEE